MTDAERLARVEAVLVALAERFWRKDRDERTSYMGSSYACKRCWAQPDRWATDYEGGGWRTVPHDESCLYALINNVTDNDHG